MPTRSLAFRELRMNLGNQAFNTDYMKTRMLRREVVLEFLLTKYNIPPSSTIIELYEREAGARISFN